MTDKQINHYFEMLNESLKKVALPTSTGDTRQNVFAGEFMLMREERGNIHFKHIGQRNYLYMNKVSGAVTIPMGGNFNLGHFDEYQGGGS